MSANTIVKNIIDEKFGWLNDYQYRTFNDLNKDKTIRRIKISSWFGCCLGEEGFVEFENELKSKFGDKFIKLIKWGEGKFGISEKFNIENYMLVVKLKT